MIRIKKILCPIDFFPASENAANYAAGLARNYDAQLKLLHVVSPVTPFAYEYVNVPAMTANIKDRTKLKLAKILGKFKASGVNAGGEIRTGEIFLGIKRAIETYKPDLVVMGTHGRRNIERWFLGSITERLLRHSPAPLMTISNAKQTGIQDGSFKQILVTTDFSDGTTDALKYAFSIAQENQARVILLHVMHIAYRAPVERDLERKLSKLVPDDVREWCNVETKLVTGTPYQSILEIAKKERIDLVVMNIHGKGMLDRALLGSNAERVVRAATCPVLLIPPMPKRAKKARAGKRAA